MKRVLIDCDPGTDDSLAIITAIKSEELKLEAITCVSGNYTSDITSRNALKILDLIEAEPIPVAKGMMTPLVRPFPKDPYTHGKDGLGDTGLPLSERELDPRFAPDVIVEMVKKYPEEIVVLSTGPMTNLALALLKEPEVAKMVKQVIATAGSFGFNEYSYKYSTGDNPVSEWNVYVDPEAARIVFRSGTPILAIGVDVFKHPGSRYKEDHLMKIGESKNPEAQYFLDLVEFIRSKHNLKYSTFIDTLAVATAIDSSIMKTRDVEVDIETKGELTLGQTVVEKRVYHRWDGFPQIKAAYDADFDRYFDLLIANITK